MEIRLRDFPLSADILTQSNIGLWAFELDEGLPPRMFYNYGGFLFYSAKMKKNQKCGMKINNYF